MLRSWSMMLWSVTSIHVHSSAVWLTDQAVCILSALLIAVIVLLMLRRGSIASAEQAVQHKARLFQVETSSCFRQNTAHRSLLFHLIHLFCMLFNVRCAERHTPAETPRHAFSCTSKARASTFSLDRPRFFSLSRFDALLCYL